MRKFLDKLYALSGGVAALCIVMITGLVFAQVVLNLTDKIWASIFGGAIGLTIPSYADFTGFFLATASFFALAYTLKEGGHIRVSLFIQRLPEKSRRHIEIWCCALASVISLYFTYYTVLLIIDAFQYNDLSSGMIAVPLWVPQSAMAMGLLVLSIALIDELFTVLLGQDPSYADKGENLLAGNDAIPSSIIDAE